MDEAKGTILTLSGLESRRLLDTFADMGCPHVQVSYYYLRKVFANPKDFEEYAKQFETVFIDHGLVYEKVNSEADKQAFIMDYINYVAALDDDTYDAVVCHPAIPKWDGVVASDKQLWSLDEIKETFDGDIGAVLSQLEYVGVSNKTATNEEEMGYIASQAKKNGTKLHAFGTSSIRVLKRWPFYSANSSSWRTGSRFANTYIYEGETRGLRIYQPTDKSNLAKTDREKRVIRTRLKNMVHTRQPPLYSKVDWDALLEDDSWEVDKANLTQWLLYQRDLELDPRNKYWLTEADVLDLARRKKELLGTMPSIEGGRDREDTTTDTPREDSKEHPNLQPDNSSLDDVTPHSRPEEIVDAELVEEPGANLAPFIGGGYIAPPVITPPKTRIKKMDPRLSAPRKCDFCILADRCFKYEAGANCAFGITDNYDLEKIDAHIEEDMADLLAIQKDRVLQGYMEEKADSSGLNKDLTNNLRLYMEMVALRAQANDQADSVSIKAKGTGIAQLFNKGGG